MFIKAQYWICGLDIWSLSNEVDVVMCHLPDGKTNIYPPNDVFRDKRIEQVKELGHHVGDLILPYTVLMNTNDPRWVEMMQRILTDALIMVPVDDDEPLGLPVEVKVVWWTIKTYDLLRSYVHDVDRLTLTEEVYTHLKMAL